MSEAQHHGLREQLKTLQERSHHPFAGSACLSRIQLQTYYQSADAPESRTELRHLCLRARYQKSLRLHHDMALAMRAPLTL
jgi:hypothetical protein